MLFAKSGCKWLVPLFISGETSHFKGCPSPNRSTLWPGNWETGALKTGFFIFFFKGSRGNRTHNRTHFVFLSILSLSPCLSETTLSFKPPFNPALSLLLSNVLNLPFFLLPHVTAYQPLLGPPALRVSCQ